MTNNYFNEMNKTDKHLTSKKAIKTAFLFLLLSIIGTKGAFANDFDFSAVCSTGQTLYYRIVNSTTNEVQLTYPNKYFDTYDSYTHEKYHYYYYWKNYTRPTGDIVIPYYVEHEGISYSVTSIRDHTFGNGDYEADHTSYWNNTTYYHYYYYDQCTDITSIVIPSSVTSIGDDAFARCTGLTSVTIPTSVIEIGNNVFYSDTSLVTVNFNAANCRSVGENTWYNCTNFTTLNLGNTVTRIPERGFQGASKITSVTIPKNVTKIGTYGFDGCTSIYYVNYNYPSQMDSIYPYAFRDCSSMRYNNPPVSLVYIGNNAFENCSALQSTPTSQLLPPALTSIGDYAFQSASSLQYIRIPSTVISIGKDAFRACTSLTRVDYEASNCTCSGTQAEPPFFECSALNTITVSDNVTQIPAYCFKDAAALTTLTLNNGLTAIGTFGFYGCQNLQSLVLPSTVNSIGSFAFGNAYDIQIPRVDSRNLTPPVIEGEVAFPAGQTIHVPGGVLDYYQSADYWSDYNLIGYYGISTTVNPSEAGVVAINNVTMDGVRLCDDGTTCRLTAIPNEGYHFVSWTENDEVVSSDSIYSFVVHNDRSLVANFAMNNYAITALANPTVGGTIIGTGQYEHGATATLTAIPNEGFTFQYWSEDGEVVSTDVSYSFTVTGNRTLEARFDGFAIHWVPNDGEFEDNMTLTCVVQFDGEEQASNMLELGAFYGNQCRGSQRAIFFAPTQRYIYQMTIFGELGDAITFKLYDHQENQELLFNSPAALAFSSNGYGSLNNPYVLNFTSTMLISAEVSPAGAGTVTGTGRYGYGSEVTLTAIANEGFQFVNWTRNGEVVSTDEAYTITVLDDTHYVANFHYLQTQELSTGWTWWSSYIELSNTNGLEQLENSLGNAGIIIKSRTNGYVEAYQNNGVTEWYGNLNGINNEQMYKIRTRAVGNATVAGAIATPSTHPITIKSGWNWIGFPSSQSVSVETAMSGYTPEPNDVIKGRNSYSTYYSDNGYQMWYGTLNALEPGKGYMYRSNSASQKTLTFQSGRGETLVDNITDENNIFRFKNGDYSDNMTITAVVDLNGEELRSESYELAAFVGEECRGSVKLMYVEPIDRYVAFLTVFGELSETMQFRLTDGTHTILSVDEMTFVIDGAMGSLKDPVTLRFGNTGVGENGLPQVSVYPNPSEGLVTVQGQGLLRVDVVNDMGQLVHTEILNGDVAQIDLRSCAKGLYLLRIVTDQGTINKQWIKK